MRHVWLIARNGAREISSSGGFFVLLFVLAAVVGLVGYAVRAALLAQADESRALATYVIRLESGIGLLGMVLGIIYGASARAREEARGTLLQVLCRPVSRVAFVLGMWMSVLLVVALLQLIAIIGALVISLVAEVPLGSDFWARVALSLVIACLLAAVALAMAMHLNHVLAGVSTVALVCAYPLGAALRELEGPLRFVGVGIEVLWPAAMPDDFGIQTQFGAPLEQNWPLFSAILVQYLLYAVVLVGLSIALFARRDVSDRA